MDLDDDEQPQDDRSNDQGMDFDEDEGDQINATIDQNDKQVRNAEFDETDSEDTGKSPEDMEDPDLYQMRREARQWAREATSEIVWEEMKRLVAFDVDLDEKEENLGPYEKTEQRGLDDNDKRDRKICRYTLECARQRYRHNRLSSGELIDADATAEDPSETAQEDIASGSQASPDQQHGFASSPGPTSNQQSTPSSADEDTSEESLIRDIIREYKTRFLVQWKDSWIKCLPAEHEAEEHSIISKVIEEKIVGENDLYSLIRWEDTWIPKSWANDAAKDAWEEEKARQKRQREDEEKMRAKKDDGSDVDASDEDRTKGPDDD